ncbi:hypothetical protein KCU65_g2358, partial [Aureobasidium melanogenum]
MALSSQHEGTTGFDTLPPELQQEIFSYLDGDNASLFAAIQVSKAWYHGCIGIVWRESSQRRLAKVPTPGRRQHYANLVFYLEVDDDLSHDLCDGLEFPSLEVIEITDGSLPVSQLRCCLQMKLQALIYACDEPDKATLEMLASCPNRIEELEIAFAESSNISSGHLLSLLQNLPALRLLDLSYMTTNIMDGLYAWKGGVVAQLEVLRMSESWDSEIDPGLRNNFLKRCSRLRSLSLDRGDRISADVLVHFASLASFETLHIDDWIADDVGKRLQEWISDTTFISQPFRRITKMVLRGGKPAVMPFISSTVTTLVHLDLHVDDYHDSICPAIGRLSNLVYLKIAFSLHKKLTHTDLDFISGLSRLQTCWIDRHYRDDLHPDTRAFMLDCSSITDLYFKSWISKLSQLRTLRLRFDGRTLTQASLQYIAKSCPLLSTCELFWEHDLSTWTSLEAPLFPNLSNLRLKGVKSDNGGQDQAMVDEHALRNVNMIRGLAPNLEFFDIRSELQHEKALMVAFRTGT